MDGIGLDNMLSAEQVEKMFSGEANTQEQTAQEEVNAGGEPPANKENNETVETAEVDFSDLLGTNQPESVGSEKNTEGNRGASESDNGSGTPQMNLFASIAKALKDEGVFPDLSDETLNGVTDAVTLRKLFEDQVSGMFDERQRNLENALSGGATTEEMKVYQNALNISQFLEKRETVDTLSQEGEQGENLRKQVMYQDYINRGFKHERAVKLIEKSIEEGNDIEDAKEALESCKDFYKSQIEDFQQELEERKKESKANEEKQYANLKKKILDTESFYDGVKVDKSIRQKAYDSLTKPIYKDEQGNYLTALQKYQKENPLEFAVNTAMMMALTDGFKNVEILTKGKVAAGMKKGFEQVAGVLNTTKRNGDGSLNLANTAPDLSERENWTLAI